MSKNKGQEKQAEKESGNKEMTMAEAKAYRASLHQPEAKELTTEEKKDLFRVFWAEEKYKYGKAKDLESILWVHLKAIKCDSPESFDKGLAHFGLKKVK